MQSHLSKCPSIGKHSCLHQRTKGFSKVLLGFVCYSLEDTCHSYPQGKEPCNEEDRGLKYPKYH